MVILMTEITWTILLCALSFMIGCMLTEIENDRFEQKLCENLKELKEIHKKIDEGDL